MLVESKSIYQEQIIKAKEAYTKAYAPYSQFKVGAAALTESGKILNGCNVENASYGLTVCAERNCIAHVIINGETRINSLVVYTEQKKLTPPCGACRQVIAEFMPEHAQVVSVNHLGDEKIWMVSQLLPDAFTPKSLLEAEK